MNGVLILRKWKEERNIRMQPNPPMPRWERLLGYILWTPKDWEFYFFYFSDCWEAKSFKFILNNCPSHGRIGKEVALCMWRVSKVFSLHYNTVPLSSNCETLLNFIKRKRPRKGEKRNKGQRPKSRQTNNPKEASHKEAREPLSTETSTSHLKHIN
jgi:hypothetical protein